MRQLFRSSAVPLGAWIDACPKRGTELRPLVSAPDSVFFAVGVLGYGSEVFATKQTPHAWRTNIKRAGLPQLLWDSPVWC